MYPSIVRSAVALLFEFCAALDVSPMNAMPRTNSIDVDLSESLFISFLHFMFDKRHSLSLLIFTKHLSVSACEYACAWVSPHLLWAIHQFPSSQARLLAR